MEAVGQTVDAARDEIMAGVPGALEPVTPTRFLLQCQHGRLSGARDRRGAQATLASAHHRRSMRQSNPAWR